MLAKVRPWVTVNFPATLLGHCEVTYWTQGSRTILFVVQKVATGGDPTGGNWAEALLQQEIPVSIDFSRPVYGAVDERTGKRLGEGRSFRLPFHTCEAVMISFRSGETP